MSDFGPSDRGSIPRHGTPQDANWAKCIRRDITEKYSTILRIFIAHQDHTQSSRLNNCLKLSWCLGVSFSSNPCRGLNCSMIAIV